MFAGNPRWTETKGQTLPLIVVFMLLLMVVCGMVLDIGNAYRVKTALQASADAAAAAGAGQLPNTGSALSTVQQYGSETGGKNPVRGSGNVTITGVANCVTSAKFCNPANTVQVTESTSVPTAFLRVIGIDTIPITVHSQACSPCGAKPLDIMVVLDRTGSMEGSKLQSATDGIKAFLSTMDTGLDNVGLAVLPPATNTSTACATPQSSNYNSVNAAYVVVPLSNTYGTMNNGNITLNNNSTLMKTINCVQAGGETAYATALDQAQAELNKDGRPGVQQVIIILSDGAANTGPGYLSANSPYRATPCHQAINSAAASKASKVLMYSIAYDIGGAGNDYCYNDNGNLEVPNIKAAATLQQIASPSNYYAQPQPAQLTTIFLAISADLAAGTARING